MVGWTGDKTKKSGSSWLNLQVDLDAKRVSERCTCTRICFFGGSPSLLSPPLWVKRSCLPFHRKPFLGPPYTKWLKAGSLSCWGGEERGGEVKTGWQGIHHIVTHSLSTQQRTPGTHHTTAAHVPRTATSANLKRDGWMFGSAVALTIHHFLASAFFCRRLDQQFPSSSINIPFILILIDH